MLVWSTNVEACYTGSMGLYVRKDETRSKLQEQIAADLRAKAAARSKQEFEGPQYDGEKDANIVQNTHTSSKLLGVWLALGIGAVATLIFLVVSTF